MTSLSSSSPCPIRPRSICSSLFPRAIPGPNRVFKAGAEEILKARLGPEVYITPTLKGPAQIEELGKAAKDLVAEWAFTPRTGTTVALWDDKRVAIKVTSSQQAFGDAVAQLEDQSA